MPRSYYIPAVRNLRGKQTLQCFYIEFIVAARRSISGKREARSRPCCLEGVTTKMWGTDGFSYASLYLYYCFSATEYRLRVVCGVLRMVYLEVVVAFSDALDVRMIFDILCAVTGRPRVDKHVNSYGCPENTTK